MCGYFAVLGAHAYADIFERTAIHPLRVSLEMAYYYALIIIKQALADVAVLQQYTVRHRNLYVIKAKSPVPYYYGAAHRFSVKSVVRGHF